MNAYEATKRMYAISEELEQLGTKLGLTSRIDDRDRIEKDINILEVEFFNLKHKMERIRVD